MNIEKRPAEKIRFGSYEVDLASCELRKGGIKLRLQPQPFQVLRLLLERPGEVVSRDELKQELWPNDTYVEFDLSLNTVIKKLRGALHDDPQHPRYVETLPRNGYRFIFPVERIDAGEPRGIPVKTILADGSLMRAPGEPGGRRPAAVLSMAPGGSPPGDRALAEAPAIQREAVVIPRKRRLLERTATAIFGVALLALILANLSESPTNDPVRRWSFPVQALSSAALSPDGKYILFAAQTGAEPGLWIRPLDRESPRELVGAEGAVIGFWSPDSQFVAFAADGQLKKISVAGGDAMVLCPLPNPNTNFFAGGTWSPDGERIVFSSGARLYQVSAGGGVSKPLFSEDENLRGSFQWPHFLPTSGQRQAIVYTASTNFRDRRMEVLDLKSGSRRNLGAGFAPVYSPDGYLIYGPANSELRGIMALPFSLEALEPSGEPFHINQDGVAASVSQAGDLVYWDDPRPVALHRLTWRDRATGRVLEPVGEAQFAMRDPVISPDGQRVLVSSIEAGDSNIYLHDLRRSTKVQLTSGTDQEAGARWSSDGSKVVFWRQTGDETALVQKAVNSGGAGTEIYNVRGAVLNLDWTRDGKYLILMQHADAGSREIRYISMAHLGEGAPSALYPGRPSRNASPRVSPDGRYLAYESLESGRVEAILRSFPDGTELRRKISAQGGRSPQWSRDGKELFYVQDATLMAVSVQASGGEITLGTPQKLFSSADLSLGFAPSLDGQRFLTIVPVSETPPPAIHMVENWHAALGRPRR